MTSHEIIQKFLDDPMTTGEEAAVIKWQYRQWGDFHTALFNAIKLAAEGNLDRLEKGFPVAVRGFKQWSRGSMAGNLRARGLDI